MKFGGQISIFVGWCIWVQLPSEWKLKLTNSALTGDIAQWVGGKTSVPLHTKLCTHVYLRNANLSEEDSDCRRERATDWSLNDCERLSRASDWVRSKPYLYFGLMPGKSTPSCIRPVAMLRWCCYVWKRCWCGGRRDGIAWCTQMPGLL